MRAPLISVSTFALLAPLPALADVTPEDVWSNLQAAAAALGGEMSADVARDGDVLSVSDMRIVFQLPLGSGSAEIAAGDMTLTDNGDGTVSMGGPAEQEIAMSADITGEGSGTLRMSYVMDGYSNTASGEPGNVSYDYEIGGIVISYDGIELDEALSEEAGTFDMSGTFEIADMVGTYRYIEGDMFRLETNGSFGEGAMDVSYSISGPDDESVTTDMTATYGEMTAEGEIELPSDGVSLLALGDALRAGMLVNFKAEGAGQSSDQTTRVGDEVFMRQVFEIGPLVQDLTLDAAGLRASGTVDSYAISVEQPMMMPFPIAFGMEHVEAEFAMPLLAEDAVQDGVLKMMVDGLEVDPGLWAMLDPQEQLPRDPAALEIDVSAGVKMLVDLVDFAALEAMGPNEMPLELHTADLRQVFLKALGAEVSAQGSFTFDNDDLETFDGMPAPDGSVEVALTGVMALVDKLVEMGLLPEDQAMGFRMMLGGFARSVGEDEFRSEIVVDGETGQVTANGQRLR
ncbi:DUF2125 domain-containing protein [Pseudoruegeria sp. HB172150]|uniref:DUF2125 domain-containing protein n=1 Tax=Pseudoruegeria sp. HB172150 TaxID=2721164 RepID=UPI001555682C|nr:DUF2125 domain-containing protein [Pseudoruegeria sp. HB172150]